MFHALLHRGPFIYTKDQSDPVEEFLEQYEQEYNTNAYNEQLYNSSNRNITHNKQQERTHNNIGSIYSQGIPKDNINMNQGDRNDNNSNDTRTQLGRLIKQPDRITYN